MIINLNEVQKTTNLSRSTILRLESLGHFPPSLKLSPRRIGWKKKDIINWIKEREIKNEEK